MLLFDAATPLRKALAANSTDSSYPAIASTTTKPTADGIVDLIPTVGSPIAANALIMPYAIGADGVTFSVRLVGWVKVLTLWVPTILGEYDCVASLAVGVAGSDVLDTERFADTLTIVANMGTDGQGNTKVSPANDTPAHWTAKIKGCQLIQFQFKKGTATSQNALYRVF